MLTAATWTYSAAGGPNPFIVPARGGYVAAAINTETGATIIGLGRHGTRFARPLRLESRGVAIFAQPPVGTLPEHAWAVGYSTTAGVPPRLLGVARDGELTLDIARPELAWREGRSVQVSETTHGVLLHIDDRHLLLDARGDVVVDLPRPGTDAPFAVEGSRLYAYDGSAIVAVDLANGRTLSRIALEGRPSALRADLLAHRLAIRVERTLLALDTRELAAGPKVRALVGGLSVAPSTWDANLRGNAGPPATLECLDDDGQPRWLVSVPGASAVFGAGFLVGGEVALSANAASGDRVLIARDGDVLLERPRAGAVVTAGAMARLGDRAATVIAPGAPPGAVLEFGGTIEVAHVRGGGAVAFERPHGSGSLGSQRMVAVDPAGALVLDVSENGAGARWAASSDGLIAVPRTNAARIDLYDTGAPA